ncbi:uncharacterized protein LOC103106213 [Monodelphis domestica]|uniref:uncharacterized protein LOC103106213 n=1 Tax=Monodelphis domestica TaxID=13616 RepID=UPI0024E1A0CF|nr:uncharacterized protein LOC103106213 [Monodelphis domestica]XP_056661963.1 uncharacterized protein LOC103106213 [Monodelphis domestica]
MSATDKENSSDLPELVATEKMEESDRIKKTPDTGEIIWDDSLVLQLPDLFSSADTLIKKNEKSSNLRIHDITVKEAKNYLLRILNIISIDTLGSQAAAYTQPIVLERRKIQDPKRMIKILHQSLLTRSRSITSKEKLVVPSKVFSQYSRIPEPLHTYPYELLVQKCLPLMLPFVIRDNILNEKILCRLVLFNVAPPKAKVFAPQTKRPKFSRKLLQPEKQFMDLRDLQWKYYKGILKWNQKLPLIFKEIPPILEKRFVSEMISSDYQPTFIFPHEKIIVTDTP